jgi:hypothetical protein
MAQASTVTDAPLSIDQSTAENAARVAQQQYDEINQRKGRGRPVGAGARRFREDSPEDKKEEFFAHTSGLTEDDWQRSLIYVYQWAPSVDLTKGGTDKKYRKIYTRHMSEEDIKRDLGSGTYELKLNQIDPRTSKDKTVDRIVISIWDFQFPPNLPPGPWLDDPKNADWAWAKPLLEQKFNKVSVRDIHNNNGPSWSEMIQFMREERRPDNPNVKDQLMSTVFSALPSLLQQQNNANDPSKIIDAMAKVKDMIAPAPPPPAQDNVMVQFLLEEVKSMRQLTNDLMSKMLDMKTETAKQPNPLEQVETMVKLVGAVSGIVQPAAPREAWQEVVSELGPGVIDALKTFATARVMATPAKVTPGAHVVPTTATPVATQTAVNPSAAPANTPPEMDTMQRSLIINVAQFAAQALNLGLTGDHFADQVCYKFGQATYDGFIQQTPKEKLLETFKGVPEAWAILQPFENLLPEFIESFYSYAEGEETEDPKSISVPVKKAKKK